MIGSEKEDLIEISVMLTSHSVTTEKPLSIIKKHLKIAEEIGDRAGERRAYGNLGNAYQSLGDYQKAIEYYKKHLKIAVEISDRAGEGKAPGNLGYSATYWVAITKPIEYHEKRLKGLIWRSW